jgi:hypothetical protein
VPISIAEEGSFDKAMNLDVTPSFADRWGNTCTGRLKGENPCNAQEVHDMEALHTKDLSTVQALVALNAGIDKAKDYKLLGQARENRLRVAMVRLTIPRLARPVSF